MPKSIRTESIILGVDYSWVLTYQNSSGRIKTILLIILVPFRHENYFSVSSTEIFVIGLDNSSGITMSNPPFLSTSLQVPENFW